MNLTTIIIQRITHAFDRTFDCAFQMFVGRMQMLERLTPDVTSIWREGGREGGRQGGKARWREGEGREGMELQLGYQNNCFPEKLRWILNEHFCHGLKCKTLWAIPRTGYHESNVPVCLPAFPLSTCLLPSPPPSLPSSLPPSCIRVSPV